ncbi:MAG: OmpA/MotB domain-containing protein [Deltaproteobacteria bacterium CSP1-8]|nr:MAG: OmpA/MotB domain-containing protein [Deltaproteobacteria bacterium CSP1-8]
MTLKLVNRLSGVSLVLLIGVFSGCAGLEHAPKRGVMYYHKELPAAERAVEAARAAGKDKECPAEFAAAEKMKNEAYDIYLACRTAEGIAKANEATARANALCPKKVEAPKPAPVMAPTPAPTVSISADPAMIDQGKCAKLAWSTTGASSASIDPGIGSVDPSGSREVCPTATTQYTIAAKGEGGTRTTSTTVTVNPPPAPKPAPKVIDRLVLHVNFDFNKSDVRKADVAELQKAIDFVKKYPGYKIAIEGHTDHIGSAKYNQALSERRAAAVKDYLLKQGMIDTHKDMITTKGYGKSKPIADNSTEKGRFENRRVEILVLSE